MSDTKKTTPSSPPPPPASKKTQEERDEAFRAHLERLGATVTEVEDEDEEEDDFWLETLGAKPTDDDA